MGSAAGPAAVRRALASNIFCQRRGRRWRHAGGGGSPFFKMKVFKSIKWRLQIWYGLILVVVLAGFGFTAYQLERGRLLGRIDDELHRRVGILANALHRPPLRG